MRNYLKISIILLLGAMGCEPDHATVQADIYTANYRAVRQQFANSGRTISLANERQYLYMSLDTLWVERNDTTILMLPNIKVNHGMGNKKRGVIVFDASTPQGPKSVRLVLGDNYRKHAESSPLVLGQVVDGKYDARFDTIQTVYETELGGLFRKPL